jgi:hypothetical protein
VLCSRELLLLWSLRCEALSVDAGATGYIEPHCEATWTRALNQQPQAIPSPWSEGRALAWLLWALTHSRLLRRASGLKSTNSLGKSRQQTDMHARGECVTTDAKKKATLTFHSLALQIK